MVSLRSLFAGVLAASCSAVFAQTTHNVLVGSSGLTFTPNQITAAVGDVVSFEFHPKNHTLTQSTFANPCTAMDGGVDSGYIPVAATDTTFPVFSFKINEVTPLWFFCAQTGHCKSGMVFAINVNASSPNTFDAYLANATGGSASTSASVTASGTASGSVPAATTSEAAGTGTGTASAAAGSATTTASGAMSRVKGVSPLLLAAVGAFAVFAL